MTAATGETSRIARRVVRAVLLGGLVVVIAAAFLTTSETSTSGNDAIRVVPGAEQVPDVRVLPTTDKSSPTPAATAPAAERLMPLPQPSAPPRGTAMPTDAEWAAPFDALRNQQQQ